MKMPCVYILANQPNGTLHIGVTANLVQRISQHKNDCVEGFTKRYQIHRLVWYEVHETRKRHQEGEGTQEMEPSVGDWVDQETQLGMGGLVR